MPSTLSQQPHETLESVIAERELLDDVLLRFCREQTLESRQKGLQFVDTEGVSYEMPLGSLLSHLFNHQTHHRGQLSTLLFQQGVDVGVTDFTVFRLTVLGRGGV